MIPARVWAMSAFQLYNRPSGSVGHMLGREGFGEGEPESSPAASQDAQALPVSGRVAEGRERAGRAERNANNRSEIGRTPACGKCSVWGRICIGGPDSESTPGKARYSSFAAPAVGVAGVFGACCDFCACSRACCDFCACSRARSSRRCWRRTRSRFTLSVRRYIQ